MDSRALGCPWPWTHFKEPFFCALLAFALNTGGYTAEMLAGAIRETDPGEVEAARAMGMGRWQIMARIVLPSAIRRTLPPYSNEVVMMLHSTSLASTVPALTDITAVASQIYSDYYLPFEAYLAAAVLLPVRDLCPDRLFPPAGKTLSGLPGPAQQLSLYFSP